MKPEVRALVEEHYNLVTQLAWAVSSKLPSSVSNEDLTGPGAEGLIEAATRFDPNNGTPFPGYARRRIVGEMLDFLRSDSFGPRRTPFKITSIFQELRGGPAGLKCIADLILDHKFPSPGKRMEDKDEAKFLLKGFNKRTVEILWLYHGLDWYGKEIAGLLGITNSRVHQIVRKTHEQLQTLNETRTRD